jgi:signal transduction histidine kinase
MVGGPAPAARPPAGPTAFHRLGEAEPGGRPYRRLMVRALLARWRADDWHVEVAIALIVAVVSAAGASVDDPGDPGEYGAWPATLAATAGVVLVVRRVLPLVTMTLVLALLTLVELSEHQMGTTTVALLFASHAVGRWSGGVRAWGGLALMWTLFAVLALGGDTYFSQPVAVLAPVIYALPFFLGRFVASRASQLETDRQAARELERSRIARELHDVVTHGLTAISVHAATARHLGLLGDDAWRHFERIEVTSRQALGDLRRMLDLLRDDAHAPTAPTPGIRDLSLLASTHREVHGPVRLDVDDAVGDVETSVGLAVYRIVQEALTNVARHAGAAPATVRVYRAPCDPGIVCVTVDDTGPSGAPGQDEGSLGLLGMRERAALFGGHVQAGPTPEGGFRVHAQIPAGR